MTTKPIGLAILWLCFAGILCPNIFANDDELICIYTTTTWKKKDLKFYVSKKQLLDSPSYFPGDDKTKAPPIDELIKKGMSSYQEKYGQTVPMRIDSIVLYNITTTILDGKQAKPMAGKGKWIIIIEIFTGDPKNTEDISGKDWETFVYLPNGVAASAVIPNRPE